MIFILLPLVILNIVLAVPRWEHSRNWGYYPAGFLTALLCLIMLLL